MPAVEVEVDEEEPTVIVDPELEGVTRTRMARGTLPPRQPDSSGRLPLEMIQQYLRENADEPPKP